MSSNAPPGVPPTVLVTGASSGIGHATALALSRSGARLLVTGRHEAALAEVAEATGASVLTADLTGHDETRRLADWALSEGPPDIVVHAAGMGLFLPAATARPVDTDPLIALNLASAVQLTGRLLPGMLERGRGRFVFITSIAGLVGVPGESAYAATKAALHHYARCLRSELAGGPVTVATFAPAVVRTPFFEHRGAPYTRRIPRPLRVDKVGDAVAALALGTGTEVVMPRWMHLPVLVQAVSPRIYARLASRLA